MEARYISCDREDNIAIVQINYPPANELSVQVIKGLDKTLDLLSEKNDINVVIITGKGRFFVLELILRRLQRKNICISSKKRNIGQKKLPILIAISLNFIRKAKSMEHITRDDVYQSIDPVTALQKNKRMIYKDIRMPGTPRLHSFILLLIITPLGFASKFYSGPGAWWFNNYAGGILYEMFWCFVVILFFPYATALWVACLVLGITSLLECLQLWHPLFLESIRSTFIGSTLIGTTFVWWDFPHYVIGCFTGWFIIKSKSGKSKYG